MKYGLVCEGGGMKCAYTAGILDDFLNEDINFDLCIGVSAGSSSLASYLAGQKDRNRRYFVDHITEPMYMGMKSLLKTGSFFGLEHIYGTMTNSDGTDPLDYEAFRTNPADFYAVATDAHTGKPVYFSREDIKQDDYRVFMASCSIPAISKPIEINGRLYFDGGVSDPVPLNKALSEGCDKVVLVLCRPANTVRQQQNHLGALRLILAKYPKLYAGITRRHELWNRSVYTARELEKEGKVFIIAPSGKLPVSTYTKDPVITQQIYDQARSDFTGIREGLLRFLGK